VSEFKQVSLGFAEFVGQLLNETFEATLEAQQHQLRRVAELEAALTLPDELFLHLHVDQDTVLEKEMAIAGAPIARQMLLHDSVQAGILALTEDYEAQSIIYQNRLTNYGFDALREVIDGLVVVEHKARINALLSHAEQLRLVVDSGEINAKLELTTLYGAELPSAGDGSTGGTSGTGVTPTKDTASAKRLAISAEALDPIKLEASLTKLDAVKTYVDPLTKETTLLFDQTSADKLIDKSPLRLSAKPLPSSTKGTVFSEVTIRFKTV